MPTRPTGASESWTTRTSTGPGTGVASGTGVGAAELAGSGVGSGAGVGSGHRSRAVSAWRRARASASDPEPLSGRERARCRGRFGRGCGIGCRRGVGCRRGRRVGRCRWIRRRRQCDDVRDARRERQEDRADERRDDEQGASATRPGITRAGQGSASVHRRSALGLATGFHTVRALLGSPGSRPSWTASTGDSWLLRDVGRGRALRQGLHHRRAGVRAGRNGDVDRDGERRWCR